MKEEIREDDALQTLLTAPAYGLTASVKKELMLKAVQEAYGHHFRRCAGYRRYCERRGFREDTRFERLEDVPFLPVQAFKEYAGVLTSVEASSIYTTLHSSATSGVASTVHVDKLTAKRQVRALTSVLSEALGPKRRPFFVVDVDPCQWGLQAMGARGAAVRGFLNLAREAHYFMTPGESGKLVLEREKLEAALTGATAGEPVVLFGFTYVLFADVVRPLLERGVSFSLPPGSFVAHIGGWKKLESEKVAKFDFNATVSRIFGVPTSHIVDFYGFTEQMGVTYPDGPDGMKYAPAFAEVIVRDPASHAVLPDGEVGLLEFVTPLPHSYPGIAVLTDDIGRIVGRAEPGDGQWGGTRFQVLGRAKKAEARGCGDIMGDKMFRPGAGQARAADEHRARVLLLGSDSYVPRTLAESLDLEKLPPVGSLESLCDRLKEAREKLDEYSVDELIALIGAASRRWIDDGSPLRDLRHQGLSFLYNWCQPEALRQLADRSLAGRRGYLDEFLPLQGTNKRMMKAQARGLAAHWLSGNVPVLGMLTLVQSILARNANILKVASTFSSVVPLLLEAFRDLELRTHGGRLLKGNDLLATLAVVYFSREDVRSAETLSAQANVRIAWGGKEAVESIMNLPRRFGTEDIVFGPKLSFMAVGREYLDDEGNLRRITRRAATDASVFDQYACASPHTIFVERGGSLASPKQFAERLAAEMQKAAVRIPKVPSDAGTAGRIASRRLAYEFSGDLWTSRGTEWTVLFDEKGDEGLVEPCFGRVITVRAIDDILQAARFAHPGIQTVGLALNGRRRLAFAAEATGRGAERCPDVGRMTFFDSPWDGVFPMERLIRWVTLGGPF